jgi:hypothetical protein
VRRAAATAKKARFTPRAIANESVIAGIAMSARVSPAAFSCLGYGRGRRDEVAVETVDAKPGAELL